MFCNMPRLFFLTGQKVRFHIMALGTEVDMHTANMASPFDHKVRHPHASMRSPRVITHTEALS